VIEETLKVDMTTNLNLPGSKNGINMNNENRGNGKNNHEEKP
jgi:hypothetical protein